MKTIVILAAASLAFVGCNQRDNTMNESAGAQKDQIEQSKDAQKDALNQQKKSIEQSKDQQEDQISAQAKAEKKQIEAQADAQKAQLDAQKKQADAQAAAAKSDVNAQQKVNEAAGAANTEIAAQTQGTDADKQLQQQVRQSFMSTLGQDNPSAMKNITVMAADGKVTLKGSVKTEGEKQNLETQAQKIPGVTSVDNQLEVK
jgi:osmotically-inducible protein OsmY